MTSVSQQQRLICMYVYSIEDYPDTDRESTIVAVEAAEAFATVKAVTQGVVYRLVLDLLKTIVQNTSKIEIIQTVLRSFVCFVTRMLSVFWDIGINLVSFSFSFLCLSISKYIVLFCV